MENDITWLVLLPLWFSDDSTCKKNSLESLFQVSKTNTPN